jgi:quinol monooxygenase YgiN
MTVRLRAASGRPHELIEALHVVMRRLRRQRGCVHAHIAADVDQPDTFFYREDWDDVAALEQEVKTDRFLQLLALMEASPEAPVMEFRVVTETRGLEYVAAVRESPDRERQN